MEYYFDEYSGSFEKKEKSIVLPTRVKQMGGLEGDIKIFIEDYVYTYLYQFARSNGGAEKLAVLVGRHDIIDNQEILLISGAIQGKGTIHENGVEVFSEETWEYIGGQMQIYFKGMSVLGWVHCQPGFGAFLMTKDERFHYDYFKEKWQVLFVLDSIDKMDIFYIYDGQEAGLRQAKGYFIYYDKNREMQEYMLANSLVQSKKTEKEEDEQEETMEERYRKIREEQLDKAENIRQILQERKTAAKEAKKEHDRLLAAVTAMLCVVCVSLGIAIYQSLERLRTVETELSAMQHSYLELAEDFEGVKVQQVFALQQEAVLEMPEKQEEIVEKNQKYHVKKGDTLGLISRNFYGDDSGITAIMELNGLQNANMIYEGQILWIPN